MTCPCKNRKKRKVAATSRLAPLNLIIAQSDQNLALISQAVASDSHSLALKKKVFKPAPIELKLKQNKTSSHNSPRKL